MNVPATKKKDQPPPAKLSILVVDDEEILTKTYVLLLEKKGYRVRAASSGGEALDLAGKNKFDLIVTDIRMPGMDGIALIKILREGGAAGPNKNTPVIFVTGFADPEKEAAALRFPGVTYLNKPFDIPQFLGAIQQSLT